MGSAFRRSLLRGALLALLPILACGDDAVGPDPVADLRIQPETLVLGLAREGEITVHNAGSRAVGPVIFESGAVTAPGGGRVLDARVDVEPEDLPTLNPGASETVRVSVELPTPLPPATYSVSVRVATDAAEVDVPVRLTVRDASADDIESLSLVEPPEETVRGRVTRLRAEARGGDGALLEAAPLQWSTVPDGAGFFDGSRFVPYVTGDVRVVVRGGDAADSADLSVRARETPGRAISVEAAAPSPDRTTADLWVHGDYAYTGTWWPRQSATSPGNALFVWDVSDPAAPAIVDSVVVDARVVNDVKVSADGSLGVLTHEHSDDGLNGVTFLDLSDPAHPSVVGRYTEGLESGVHNVWLDGDHAYVVVDGNGNGLRVLDISDPSQPEIVAEHGSPPWTFLHDVYVRDGLAFLSNWRAGLVILDVGHGIAGGSPEAPVEVSRIRLGGETHNAWYWPEAGYVFVGDEDFGTPGEMHVVDVRDLRRPREVATYAVPGDPPHNFWLDEDEEVLYAAWYSQGVRAIDVGGDLLGELHRQGREVAVADYGGTASCPGTGSCTWAPQLHEGRLFLSDMGRGLVVATPAR